MTAEDDAMPERQLTTAACGHLLTNAGVWSPDSRWLVYDVRSDPAGAVFDGTRIERVEAATGRVEVLYESRRGACCGVATVNPIDGRVAFILGPENPAGEWTYGPDRRQGVLVDPARPGAAANLDARDLAPPFTPGALRGGTHVHQFDARGEWASFTYDDHVLARPGPAARERAVRMVAAATPRPVRVPRGHPRNHDGGFFAAVVTDVVDAPRLGSDEIDRAYEDAWLPGLPRRVAFLGDTAGADGKPVTELFLAELPDDLSQPGPGGPLTGSLTTRPRPPRGCTQRRLTHTASGRHPGLAGAGLPRFWPRPSPDGTLIAFLLRDDAGVAQLWTVPVAGGAPRQRTFDPEPVSSAFTWSPCGRWLAHVRGRRVCLAELGHGRLRYLTAASAEAPRPEACVFSPDGRQVAFVRPVRGPGGLHNQIFVCPAPGIA